MSRSKSMAAAAATVLLGLTLIGCAPGYAPSGGFTIGGYTEKQLTPDIWRVHYSGNGYTNRETAQTYWLFRCAELALEKGFEGFAILSNIQLVLPETPTTDDRTLHLTRGGGVIFIPMYGGGGTPGPSLEADVQLLRQPFEPVPARVFDAVALRRTLEPLVKGEKCGMNNVCPHPHHYVYPRRTEAPAPERQS